tara:strand:- start:142 stop:378 length:237 start_codon:yes stop_codon:yes gene_type:complete
MDDALDKVYESIAHLYIREDRPIYWYKYRMVEWANEMFNERGEDEVQAEHGRTCECFPCQQANYRMDRDDPSVGGYEG